MKGRFEKMKWVEYGQSKWGDVALARCLHWVYGPDEGREKRKAHIRRVGKGEIISISIHPGGSTASRLKHDKLTFTGMVAANLAQHISLTPYVLKWIPWAVVRLVLYCPESSFSLTVAQQRFITRTPSIGALNQLWAATCPNATARSLSGEYVVPFQRFGRARMDLDDADRVQAVWKWCEVQAKRVS